MSNYSIILSGNISEKITQRLDTLGIDIQRQNWEVRISRLLFRSETAISTLYVVSSNLVLANQLGPLGIRAVAEVPLFSGNLHLIANRTDCHENFQTLWFPVTNSSPDIIFELKVLGLNERLSSNHTCRVYLHLEFRMRDG